MSLKNTDDIDYTRKLNINITAIVLHNFYNKSYFGESNKNRNDIINYI